jgi:two-component system response regulator RegX3
MKLVPPSIAMVVPSGQIPVVGQPGAASVPKNILVAEDERLILEYIHRILERAGYEAILAPDGPTALQLFHQRKPHLVLLDLMLPGMSGWEVCRQIRDVSTVPIIMVTVLSSRDDIARGLTLGADDYVLKPFDDKELLAGIQAVLRRSRRSPPRCLPKDSPYLRLPVTLD